MNEKLKIILGVVLGIICAVVLFSLIVIIGCSVNGLTFGEQVCEWFGGNTTITDNQPAETPISNG